MNGRPCSVTGIRVTEELSRPGEAVTEGKEVGVKERGGENRSGGRSESSDKWRMQQRRGAQEREISPCGALAGKIRPAIHAGGECEEVKDAMEKEVLTVIVPKQPEPKDEVKSIEISV
ncbi:hypothetical protein KI387_027776 [Taxus chinensis]|uniref:SHSP domain-containing protein n=1 Tax=Taxus chinensis TaxID=29808 RepID=A0AA38L494_TAXCH|nr:hypothetical protein KI387_027776 [Taxus chinensis]